MDNTTADADLGACVVKAVRTFNFPVTLDAEVAEGVGHRFGHGPKR